MTGTSTDVQDTQDMECLAAGQDAGLDHLMDRYSHRLFCYLLRLLTDAHEAEEVTQETFVKVFLNRARFKPQYRFSSWVYTIATNLARDHLRRRQRSGIPRAGGDPSTENNRVPESPDPRPDPRDSLLASEQRRLIQHAIHSLPEDLQIPILLSEYEKLTHRDIGQILGCTPKAVEMRLYRARQALREQLAPLLAGS